MTPGTLQAALDTATRRLAAVSATPALDAEVLLAHVLGRDRSHLRAWPQRALEPAAGRAFAALLERRTAGEPVAYLTGRREFWSLPLRVTRDTLIPRPETEQLVEAALARLPAAAAARVLDLGTGSGAIALAIARERPHWRVTATDASPAALAVAAGNARALGITNTEFIGGDWYAAVTGRRFDLICSNPPYLRRDDPHLHDDSLPCEPQAALVAGETGLEAVEAVAAGASGHLAPGGWLLLEHGCDQRDAVARCLARAGLTGIESLCDLAGLPRVAAGRLPA